MTKLLTRDNQSSNITLAVFIALVPALFLVFCSPLAVSCVDVGANGIANRVFRDNWVETVLMTLMFGSFTVLLSVVVGFALAVLLRTISRSFAVTFPFLLWSILLGNGSVGFLIKLLLLQSASLGDVIAHRRFFETWGAMLSVQCWQYIPLFFFLFWLKLQSTPRSVVEFACASRLSTGEFIRDALWPECRNLAAVLILFAFVQSIQEYGKFQFILHASQGTDTELVSHRLLRFYKSAMLVDPRGATHEVLALSFIWVIIGLTASAIVIPVTLRLMSKAVELYARLLSAKSLRRASVQNLVAFLLLLVSAIPLLSLLPFILSVKFISLYVFFKAIVWTSFTLFFVMVVCVTLCFCARVVFLRALAGLGGTAVMFLIALNLILFIPPIGLVFCGYEWVVVLGVDSRSVWAVVLTWLAGQVFLVLPAVTTLLQYNNFGVRSAEIDWQQLSRVSRMELLGVSFVSRLRFEYLLVALFGFSLIWNEVSVNSMVDGMAYGIPSLARELAQRVDGRGSSYDEAVGLLLASFIPILIAIFLWTRSGSDLWDSRGVDGGAR